MNMTQDRLRSAGWAAVLLVAIAFALALAFKVNTVRSQVRLTERRIVALQQEKLLLETEFETRANQQQLKALNDVEFGYQAPGAGQYLKNERQLAALGVPRDPGAPAPIRVARNTRMADNSLLSEMVGPLTGRAMAAEVPRGQAEAGGAAAGLGNRLSTLARGETARP